MTCKYFKFINCSSVCYIIYLIALDLYFSKMFTSHILTKSWNNCI